MTCPKQSQIEEKLMVPPGSGWQPFHSWHPDYVYRIKPKPKVKKWRWVYGEGEYLSVTLGHYAENERDDLLQKIDSTMIEVEE